MKKMGIIIGLLIILVAFSGFSAENKKTIALIGMEFKSVDEGKGNLITDYLVESFLFEDKYNIVSRITAEEVFQANALSLADNLNLDTLNKAGLLVKADYIISGSIYQFNQEYFVRLHLYDVAKNKIVHKIHKKFIETQTETEASRDQNKPVTSFVSFTTPTNIFNAMYKYCDELLKESRVQAFLDKQKRVGHSVELSYGGVLGMDNTASGLISHTVAAGYTYQFTDLFSAGIGLGALMNFQNNIYYDSGTNLLFNLHCAIGNKIDSFAGSIDVNIASVVRSTAGYEATRYTMPLISLGLYYKNFFLKVCPVSMLTVYDIFYVELGYSYFLGK